MDAPSTPGMGSLPRHGSIRSILKRSSNGPLAPNVNTPGRNVTFTASTISPTNGFATPTDARKGAKGSYSVSGGIPQFHADDGERHVIVDEDSPTATTETDVHLKAQPPAHRLKRTPSQLDLLFAQYDQEAMAPTDYDHMNAGESTADIPDNSTTASLSMYAPFARGRQFLDRLRQANASPEPLLAASTNSFAGSHNRTEVSNIFDAELPTQMSMASSVAFSEDNSNLHYGGEHRTETTVLAGTPPSKEALASVNNSRSTPTSTQKRSLTTKAILLSGADTHLCDEFGTPIKTAQSRPIKSSTLPLAPKQHNSATPAHGSYGRSGARGGMAKVAAMLSASSPDMGRPRSPSKPMSRSLPDEWLALEVSGPVVPPKSVATAERETQKIELPLEIPDTVVDSLPPVDSPGEASVNESIVFATAPTTPCVRMIKEKSANKEEHRSISKADIPKVNKSPKFDDSDLDKAYTSLFSLQSDLMDNADSHRSLLLAFITNLQREVEAKDEEISELLHAKELAEQGWDDAIEEAGRFEEEMLAKAAKHESTQSAALALEIEQMKARLVEHDQTVVENKDLQSICDTLKVEVDTKVQDNQSLKAAIDKIQKSAQEEVAEAEEKLSRVIVESEECIAELEDELQKCRDAMDDSEARLTTLIAEKDALVKVCNTERHETSEYRRRMEEELDNWQARYDSLTTEHDAAVESAKVHEQRLKHSQRESDKLETQLSQTAADALALKSALEERSNQFDALSTQYDGIFKSNEEHRLQQEAHRQRATTLEAEVERLTINAQNWQKRAQTAEDSLYRLEEGSTAQVGALEASRERIDQLESSIRDLSQQLAVSDRANTAKEEHISTLLAEADRPSLNKEQVEELETLRLSIRKLRMESTTAELRAAKLEKRNAQLQEDQDGMSIALDAKQVEIQLLKRQLRDNGQTSAIGLTPAVCRTNRRSSSGNFKIAETPLARQSLNSVQLAAVSSTIKKPASKPRRISFGVSANREPANENQRKRSSLKPRATNADSHLTSLENKKRALMELARPPTLGFADNQSEVSSEYETAAYA